MGVSTTNRTVTIRIRGKVTDTWRAVIRDADRVLVFSPYVTNPTASELLAAAGERCHLYTVLDPMNFARGASSLDALKKLVGDQGTGVKLYRLDDLHAKLVIVPGRLVTVGSQNLTRNGASPRRQEATAVVTDPRLVERARKEVAEWMAAAEPVSREMLDELAVEVRRLKRKLKAIEGDAKRILEEAIANQRDRDQAAQAETEPDPPEPHKRRDLVEDRLSQLRATAEAVRCRVFATPTGELRTRGQDRFDKVWRAKADRLKRFVCFDARTMRWGWARVASGRISRIHQGLTRFKTLNYLGRPLKMSLDALPVKAPEEPNLAVTVKYQDEAVCKLTGMLTLDSIIIDEVLPKDGPHARLFDFDRMRIDINHNRDGLRDALLGLIADPFEYIDGEKLIGMTPMRFLGPGYFTALIGEIGQNRTLVMDKTNRLGVTLGS